MLSFRNAFYWEQVGGSKKCPFHKVLCFNYSLEPPCCHHTSQSRHFSLKINESEKKDPRAKLLWKAAIIIIKPRCFDGPGVSQLVTSAWIRCPLLTLGLLSHWETLSRREETRNLQTMKSISTTHETCLPREKIKLTSLSMISILRKFRIKRKQWRSSSGQKMMLTLP